MGAPPSFRRETRDTDGVGVDVAFRGNVLRASVAVVRAELRRAADPTERAIAESGGSPTERGLTLDDVIPRVPGRAPQHAGSRNQLDKSPGCLRRRSHRRALASRLMRARRMFGSTGAGILMATAFRRPQCAHRSGECLCGFGVILRNPCFCHRSSVRVLD